MTMTGGGILSGGVVFLIAAALWLIYLVPTWFRRGEYLATERNAVRLQQTLRILAETAEIPEQVRLEATAREVAAQQRVLKRVQAEKDAKARAEADLVVAKAAAEAAAARAAAAAQRARLTAAKSLARSRRRARLATTVVLLAGVVVAGVGAAQFSGSGEWMLLASGGAVSVLSVALLARMARVAGRVPVAVSAPVAAPIASEIYDADLSDLAPAPVAATWTPQPLPKPLYLSQGSSTASVMATADAHSELRRAALAEAMSQRSQEIEPAAASLAEKRALRDEELATQFADDLARRYASMGVIDETEIMSAGVADLVQRRRAVS